jgi:AraC family transcriptional activator of pobA
LDFSGACAADPLGASSRAILVRTPRTLVPNFFLYGEAPRDVGERFLHVEPLDDRSRPSNWNIRPHAHANLHHVFFIAEGGGEMRADDAVTPFTAPCLLTIPVAVAHGFVQKPDTAGVVVTIAEPYLRDLIGREPDFAALFRTAECLDLTEPAARRIAEGLDRLSAELVWAAPGRRAAVEAALTLVLVEALRQAGLAAAPGQALVGPQADLVARFRDLVERSYRAGPALAFYLDALGVSESRLRQACVRIAGRSPLRIIHDRVIVEAKRVLLYTNMTVAETGRWVGFDDPAYFSRFFSKHEKQSPRAFRGRAERRRGEG